MDEVIVERVLRAVEQVPPGRVVAYGDIAVLVGIGPRQVGSIMRHWGGNVAWWRVTNRDGDLGHGLLARARPHWDAEGIVVKANGLGCRMSDFRADLAELAGAYEAATAELAASGDSGEPHTAG